MADTTRPPLVSVILPVYNGLPFLAEAVESIRSQTLTDWELIAVDDGSTDGSRAVLEAAAASDDRIRLIEHPANRGIGAAYHAGVSLARGRYLAFQEQDDRSLPHRLEREVEALERHGVPIVSSRVGLLDERGSLSDVWPADLSGELEISAPGYQLNHQILVAHTNIANATMMLDRTGLDPAELVVDDQFRRCCQDADLQMRLVLRHPSLRLSDVLVHQRRSPAHRSATSDAAAMVPDMRRLLRKHRPELGRHAPRGAALRTWLRAWSTQLHFEAGTRRRNWTGWALALGSLLLWPGNPRIARTVGRRPRPPVPGGGSSS